MLAARRSSVISGKAPRLLGCDELFVIEQGVSTEVVGNVPFAVVHQHQMLEVGERVEQRGEQRDDRAINKDHLVIGVVHDVGQLLREQPDVQRVQHSAGTWSSEIQL